MERKTKNVAKTALVVALMCVCAWVSVPFGVVVFTLQTLGAMIALQALGGTGGIVAIVIYLLLGAVGLPVFSSFGGGFGVLLGPTGGFLFGFLFGGAAYLCSERIFGKNKRGRIVGLCSFLFVCYIFGCGYYALGYGVGLKEAVTVCVLPYVVPEIVKLCLAVAVGGRIVRYL